MAPKPAEVFTNGERGEEIEGSRVVPDGFHGAARVAEAFEIGRVVREVRVGGRDRDVAARGEFAGVLAVGFAAEPDDDTGTGGLIGGVETEDGGKRVGGGGARGEGGFGDAEEGGSAAAGLGLIGEAADYVSAAVDLFLDAHVERDAFGRSRSRECAHDGLHAADNFDAAVLPIGGRAHGEGGVGGARGVAADEEVFARQARGSAAGGECRSGDYGKREQRDTQGEGHGGASRTRPCGSKLESAARDGLQRLAVGLGAADADFEAEFGGESGFGVEGEVGFFGAVRVGDLDVVGLWRAIIWSRETP
jgi:hypothetical protein